MSEQSNWSVVCPCCETMLMIDARTGAIISHEEKSKPVASFEDMARDMEKQKQHREQLFAQELNSQKDRHRLLDEKFREALKRADQDKDKPYINPLDVD